MLSMESMIKIQAAGAGEDGRPFPSRFPENFLRYLSFLSCSRDPGRAVEDAARREGNRGREIWDITDDPVAVPKISALPYGGRLKF